jgi:hypothetical protein
MRAPLLIAAFALAALALAGCAALRPPPELDPDRTRHTFSIVGEVRDAKTLAVVPGAEVLVTGADEDRPHLADATGRFAFDVRGIAATRPDPSGTGRGPAGFVVLEARSGRRCAPETRVVLPSGPVTLLVVPCPPAAR